jgi:hypothetical protein
MRASDAPTRAALANAGFTTHDALRDHVKANSADLILCCELTIGYKHLELTGYTLAASQIDQASLSVPSSLQPHTALSYRFVPKIKTRAGTNLSAVQVYKDALSSWDRLFKLLGF